MYRRPSPGSRAAANDPRLRESLERTVLCMECLGGLHPGASGCKECGNWGYLRP